MTPAPATLPLLPTAEERQVRTSVREISLEYGPGYFQQVVAAGESPTALWRDLGAAGFLGPHLPEQYGGGGGGLSELSWVVEETAAAGVPALSAVFSAGVNGSILAQHGTQDQQKRWLPGLVDGSALSAFAITEPDAGTNSFRISTTAVPDGDDWVISGQKYYVSGVDEADWVIVVARTGVDEANGRARLTLFLVDTGTPGLDLQPLPTALEIPEKQSTVYLDDVRVPQDRVVGPLHDGMRTAFAGLNAERLLVSSICTGVGRYALDKAVDYARTRQVWGAPIGSHQGLSHPLAEAKIELESARWLTTRALALYDAGLDTGEYSNMAKLTGVDAGLHCLDAAIQTHGGNGVSREYQLANYWFLLRTLKIGPVSREMVLNFIAEHALGLPKSY
jgi:alkylation response protein AidB-like acyl-CoA dehydrogenase